MIFDEQPDAPLHGECADAIHTLEAEVASLKKILALADAASRERDVEIECMRNAMLKAIDIHCGVTFGNGQEMCEVLREALNLPDDYSPLNRDA